MVEKPFADDQGEGGQSEPLPGPEAKACLPEEKRIAIGPGFTKVGFIAIKGVDGDPAWRRFGFGRTQFVETVPNQAPGIF